MWWSIAFLLSLVLLCIAIYKGKKAFRMSLLLALVVFFLAIGVHALFQNEIGIAIGAFLFVVCTAHTCGDLLKTPEEKVKLDL